jgi:transposase
MEQNNKRRLKNIESDTNISEHAGKIIITIMCFLQLFIPKTLAKRILSLLLIVAGVPNEMVTQLTGLCDKSVRDLRKAVQTGDIDGLLCVGGGGRKSKLSDVEENIIEEIEKNNYNSRQQIADMIKDKFGIEISVSAVGRFLKKTG